MTNRNHEMFKVCVHVVSLTSVVIVTRPVAVKEGGDKAATHEMRATSNEKRRDKIDPCNFCRTVVSFPTLLITSSYEQAAK